LASYPLWQAYLRRHGPPTLVVWGRYDSSFTTAGAEAYGRDVPDAEIHLLDAGHFALDEAADEIAGYVRDLLGRKLGR
jgi:pimeloyl-ACP methyl ester carboxylesterase